MTDEWTLVYFDGTMPQKNEKTSKKRSKNALKERRGYTKITKEHEEIMVNMVLKGEEIHDLWKKMEASKSGFYRYLKHNPKFREELSHARARRAAAFSGQYEDLEVLAYEGISELLRSREVERYTVKRERQVNEETGEETEWTNETERRWNEIYRPSIKAIEKVLGPDVMKYAMMERVLELREGGVLSSSKSKAALKEWADYTVKAGGEEGPYNIFGDTIDLLNIRAMQAEAFHRYEKGLMSFSDYINASAMLTKTYQMAKHNIELRYAKLMGGKSYHELHEKFQAMFREFVFVAQEVESDESVERGEIILTAINRVQANAGRLELSITSPDRLEVGQGNHTEK